MEVIQTLAKKTKKGYAIHLPEISDKPAVEVVVILPKETMKNKPGIFFGKLRWKGDALAWQKKIRNEWE